MDKTLELLRAIAFKPFMTLGGNSISVASIGIVFAIVAAGILASRLIQRLARSQFGDVVSFDTGLGYAMLRIGHYLVVAMTTLVALQTIGFNLTGLTVVAGFLGVGLGFGLQNLTANFISGLILLIEQPVSVGDRITAGEHIGTVSEIGIRSTTLYTLDNVTIILPNSALTAEQVTNWSHGDPKIRIHVPFGVAYGSDVPKVRATVLDCVRQSDYTMEKPGPEVRFLSFGDSSLDFEALIWIPDPWMQFRAKSDLYYRIEDAFRRGAIEIPFPQRDLHVRSGLREAWKN